MTDGSSPRNRAHAPNASLAVLSSISMKSETVYKAKASKFIGAKILRNSPFAWTGEVEGEQ